MIYTKHSSFLQLRGDCEDVATLLQRIAPEIEVKDGGTYLKSVLQSQGQYSLSILYIVGKLLKSSESSRPTATQICMIYPSSAVNSPPFLSYEI